MADTSVLRIDLKQRQPADAAEAVSWHLHPLRGKISLSEHSYRALVFTNALKAREPKSLPPIGPGGINYSHPYLLGLRVRCEIDEHLHVLVEERYFDLIIVFPEGADEDIVRQRFGLGKLEIVWEEFSVDIALKERNIHGGRLLKEMGQQKDIFMTDLKEEMKKVVDRTLNPKFLELSQQNANLGTQNANIGTQMDEINKKLAELLSRKP